MSSRHDECREISIADLCAQMPEDAAAAIQPQGDGTVVPSAERIRELALEKRAQETERKEEPNVKKAPIKILLIAALICALTLTVFAAVGGLDFFRAKFGDSAGAIAGSIHSPQIEATASGRTMALEAVLTDGYVTNLVVSLTGKQPDSDSLFHVFGDVSFTSYGWSELYDFSTKEKTYYSLELNCDQRFEQAEITLELNEAVAPIQLAFVAENSLGNAVVTFPGDAFAGEAYALRELQVSPMGFLAIAYEPDAKGSLPDLFVELVMANGETEYMDVEFDDGEETITGGGGAIILGPGEVGPLVIGFQGRRNPDGEVVTNGNFSRVIDPGQIVKVVVDGREFLVD